MAAVGNLVATPLATGDTAALTRLRRQIVTLVRTAVTPRP